MKRGLKTQRALAKRILGGSLSTQGLFGYECKNTYSQWQRGTLSKDDWQLYRAVICLDTAGASALRSTFDDHRVVLSTGFQDFIAGCWAESPGEKN